MPLEPNKKIEELLARYVKERRGKTDANFDLHPATRKIFQDEVARTFPKTETTQGPKTFVWLWPRLAFAGVITALFVVVLMQLNTPQKSPTQIASSFQATKGIMEAAPKIAEETKTFSRSNTDKIDSFKKEVPLFARKNSPPQPEVIANSRAVEMLQDRAEKISQPTGGNLSFERDADAPMKTPARKSEKFLTIAETASRSAISAASTPAPAAAMHLDAEDRAASSARWKFVQQNSRAQYRQNLLSPPQPKILESFELIQAGNKIQLIDRDGSVYEGELLNPAKDVSAVTGLNAKQEHSAGFAFRVSGTSQPLGRVISFTGIFFTTNTDLGLSGKVAAGNAGELKKQTVSKSGVIRGKVSVGGTNEFEIQAVESSR